MYCPNCAAQNVDGASFCRACGANISLVPQALTGTLPEARTTDGIAGASEGGRRRRKHQEPVTIEEGVQKIVMGIGFLVVALLALGWAPAGHIWWFWMLIPAFTMTGGGVSTIMRAKRQQKTALMPNHAALRPVVPPAPRFNELHAPGTSEIVPPASVTEGTTRHLNMKDAAPSPRNSVEP